MDTPLRILAIDDEPSVTLSLRYVFSGPRYEMLCVENGNLALAKLDVASDPYDVIIVDQKMLDLTGIELVEAIRKRGISGKINVVSVDLLEEVREAYERLDVHVILAKPFNFDQLRSAVDRII